MCTFCFIRVTAGWGNRIKQLKDVKGFPSGLVPKESVCKAGDTGLIPGLGRSHGEGNGNPLLYSCLENPMDRGARISKTNKVTSLERQSLGTDYLSSQSINTCLLLLILTLPE